MLTSSAITFAAFWFMVKSLPGLLQSVACVFGILLASWLFEKYVRFDCEEGDE